MQVEWIFFPALSSKQKSKVQLLWKVIAHFLNKKQHNFIL